MWPLLLIPGALVLCLAVLIVRALTFTPTPQPKPSEELVTFDAERATDALRTLVTFRTVSYRDPSLEDDAEFEKLIDALPALYPNVMKTCSFTRLADRGLLFRWKGEGDSRFT